MKRYRLCLFWIFSFLCAVNVLITLAPQRTYATDFEFVGSEIIYQQADLIAVVKVINSKPFSDAFAPVGLNSGADVRFQIEELIRGTHKLQEFQFRLFLNAKIGDRFLVFLKNFHEFGGEQGIYCIDEKGLVPFIWWPNDKESFVPGEGYTNIIVIPHVPVTRAVSLIKSILDIAPEDRNINRIKKLVVNKLSDIDPYDLFHELENKAGWGIVTLERLSFPKADRALVRILKQIENEADRDKVLTALCEVQKERRDAIVLKRLKQEFENKIYESDILKRLGINLSAGPPRMVLRIDVTEEGKVNYVEINSKPGRIREIGRANRAQLSFAQQKVMDEIYTWEFKTKAGIYTALVARIDGRTIDNLRPTTWIDCGHQ